MRFRNQSIGNCVWRYVIDYSIDKLINQVLTLMAHMRPLLRSEPIVPYTDRPFEVDAILKDANRLFVEHNISMDTVVVECCGGDVANRMFID